MNTNPEWAAWYESADLDATLLRTLVALNPACERMIKETSELSFTAAQIYRQANGGETVGQQVTA